MLKRESSFHLQQSRIPRTIQQTAREEGAAKREEEEAEEEEDKRGTRAEKAQAHRRHLKQHGE